MCTADILTRFNSTDGHPKGFDADDKANKVVNKIKRLRSDLLPQCRKADQAFNNALRRERPGRIRRDGDEDMIFRRGIVMVVDVASYMTIRLFWCVHSAWFGGSGELILLSVCYRYKLRTKSL